MAKQINYRFNFHTSGVSNLLHARNVIKSFGGTSWIAANAMSRSFSSAEKSAKSLMGTLVKMSGMAGVGLGAGLLTKGLIMNSSELQTNMIVFKNMMKGQGDLAKEMITELRDNAAEYGFDEGEVFKSARGLYSAYASQGRKVSSGDMMELMKMVETVSMMDTENRGLSFTAFAFKEIAQGQGKLDFRSLTNRLEIPFTQATQQAITKALQSGDVKKATEMMWKGLKESNIGQDLLKQIAKDGFIQNLNAIKGYTVRTFQTMGMPIVEMFAGVFNKVKEAMRPMMKVGSDFMVLLETMGQRAAQRMEKSIGSTMVRFGKWLQTFSIEAWLKKMTDFAAALRGVVGAGFGNIKAFLEGIAGTNSKTDFIVTLTKVLNDMKPVIKSLEPVFRTFGEVLGSTLKILADNPDLVKALVAGKVANTAVKATTGTGLWGWLTGAASNPIVGGAAAGAGGAAAVNAAKNIGIKGGFGLHYGWTNSIKGLLVSLQKDIFGGGIMMKVKTIIWNLRIDFTHIMGEMRKIWKIITEGSLFKAGSKAFNFVGGLTGMVRGWAGFSAIDLLGKAGGEFHYQNMLRNKGINPIDLSSKFAPDFSQGAYNTVFREQAGDALTAEEQLTLQRLRVHKLYDNYLKMVNQTVNRNIVDPRVEMYYKSRGVGLGESKESWKNLSNREKIFLTDQALLGNRAAPPKVNIKLNNTMGNAPVTINQYIQTNDPKKLADGVRPFINGAGPRPNGYKGPDRVGTQYGGAAMG